MPSNKTSKSSSIQEEDKRELLQRSPGSKKYVTIISQDFFQKSGLSLEAMGLISYLMSLPDDWVVYNHHLQKTFKIGRDKLRKIMKELKEKGYMQRIPIKDNKGRVVTWKTQYSDYPEFLRLVQVTENPSPGNLPPGNPCPGKQPLQINNNTKETNYKKTITTKAKGIHKPKPEPQNPSQEPDPNVVVALMENVNIKQWAIAETLLRTWLKKHSAEYILCKIEYTKSYATKNPAGLLRRAIEHDYKLPLNKQAKLEANAHAEPVYPSHEENLAWYATLSDEGKQKCFEQATHKHAHFEMMLKNEKVDFKSLAFLNSHWFKMMMQIVGRKK